MANMIGISQLRNAPDEPIGNDHIEASRKPMLSPEDILTSLGKRQKAPHQTTLPPQSLSLSGRQAAIQSSTQLGKTDVEQKILMLISSLADQLADPTCDVQSLQARMILLQDLIASVKSL